MRRVALSLPEFNSAMQLTVLVSET